MGVSLDMLWICDMLCVVVLYAKDGGCNEFGWGNATGVHERGGEEGGIRMQVRYLRLVALRRFLREDTLVESMMEVKVVQEGTW